MFKLDMGEPAKIDLKKLEKSKKAKEKAMSSGQKIDKNGKD